MTASTQPAPAEAVGIVVIGRNEGDRLQRCLSVLAGHGQPIVYVDSGSTDGSLDLARTFGVEVVELDLSIPFTAARARNAGFRRLMELAPDLAFVQFIDGDCELDPGWLATAVREMRARTDCAVVCGRRRELNPRASVYNRLCDMEWNTPIGTSSNCGGDALMRVAAFRLVDGFDPALIAGEEPDLCLRLRLAGFEIRRIDTEMTRHDAAIFRLGQWWNREVRTGHTAAEGLAMRGLHVGRVHLRRSSSAVLWALVAPLCALALGLASGLQGSAVLGWTAAGILALYALLFARIYRYRSRCGDPPSDSALYAGFCILGKWPEVWGVGMYLANRVRGRRASLIEYKGAEPRAAAGGIGRRT